MSNLVYHIVVGYGLMIGAVLLTVLVALWFDRLKLSADAFVLPSIPAVAISSMHGIGIVHLCLGLAVLQGGARTSAGIVVFGLAAALLLSNWMMPLPGRARMTRPSAPASPVAGPMTPVLS